jgi:oligoendopeptidase F
MENEPLKNNMNDTSQERREKKLRKKKARMKKHGKSLAQMYKDAIEKRVREKGTK